MTIYKCSKCKKIVITYFHIEDKKGGICEDCLKEISRSKKMKKEICPICKNSKVDDRTLPSTECNCLIAKELEI